MLGFGETEEEVIGAMRDLRVHQCDYLTLGQYLAPSDRHYPVKEFIHPQQFKKYRDIAMGLGFKAVSSGPKVRSSYQAQKLSMELEYA
jgi:lipoic acid synthetase